MQRARFVAAAAFGIALAGCSTGIPDLNEKPTKYYQETVTLKGRISRMQQLQGEVLMELADAHEHRVLVRAPAPVDVQVDDWVKVKGIFVPEARVGDRIVYDLLQAEDVSHTTAPWFRNLF
ncbi:MAG TPA: hypothetical protein VMS22_22665 [Candidatus Eisenbacteria bacterium]|nr:hypothetical protein [Candidatus Eisenbacteria bacterium]